MEVTGAARGIREDVGRAAPATGGGLPVLDHIERNRAAWELWAPRSAAKAKPAWVGDELRWGIWGTRESELGLLDGLPRNASVVELGCGTASVSAWIARRGMRPVGVDFVRAQLETAARLERELGIHFPLLCADVERLHFDQGTFDLAISEYGASLWCEPARWLAEASRILRPGGRLVFFTSSPLLITCTPDDGSLPQERLVRDYFSRHRVEFPDNDGAVEFHLTHGAWIDALGEAGLVLESLVETQPAADAPARTHLATREWARRWPTEEIWLARKRD